MKMKRMLAPKFWKVPKKVKKWVVRPKPGPHGKFECIPLQIIVRDILKLAETGKEAKTIIKNGEILVDNKIVKDHKYPVGLMDTVAVLKLDQYYRLVPTPKGLELIKIPEGEHKLKVCKIKNKTLVKGGKLQLNLHDGRNILVDKKDYKTGDSVLIELPNQRIIDHIKFEPNNIALVTKGRNGGVLAKIKRATEPKFNEPAKVTLEIENKNIEILKDYVLVVGKEKPTIYLGEQ